tara:strand:- start:500 stop:1369 length:870 start_codon:yes stop_codon:yes gene_type:complete
MNLLDHNFINKNFQISYFDEPFPFVIIRDFFEKKFYKEIENNFPILSEFKNQKNKINRMNFDTSYGDELYENLIKRSNEYKTLHNWVYSKNFLNFFIKFFEKDILKEKDKKNLFLDLKDFKLCESNFENHRIFNKNDIIKSNKIDKILYPRFDLGTGIKSYGIKTGGKGPHIDNPQRLISILFYCGGFDYIKGGEHRIYEIDSIQDTLKVFKSIFPEKNSLIASLQNNVAYHDVNPVNEIKGQRNAFYMAISSNVKIWKTPEKNSVNKKYNKNRYKYNFFEKLLKKIVN